MSSAEINTRARPFLDYLADWTGRLPELPLAQAISDPTRAAVVCVDMVNGFCHQGPLASPRVHALIKPLVDLLGRAHDCGVRRFALCQDSHEPDAVEFAQWPRHCVRGTPEADTIPEITRLPFFNTMTILPKNSLNAAIGTGLDAWLDANPDADNFIVAGDCTDLCVHQLAMHLRLDANARQRRRRVIVPANCVDTYHLPPEEARKTGAPPHDGDLLHAVFLYHMALNGIDVARAIT